MKNSHFSQRLLHHRQKCFFWVYCKAITKNHVFCRNLTPKNIVSISDKRALESLRADQPLSIFINGGFSFLVAEVEWIRNILRLVSQKGRNEAIGGGGGGVFGYSVIFLCERRTVKQNQPLV